MPADSKDNQNKRNKNIVKEQRKPRSPKRHTRNQGCHVLETKEKLDTKPEASAKPSQEPGPEFYKNLKRETEEILKISEEAHSKYVKKEIHSNWKKYELPIMGYDDIEEQENIGADFEQLIQTPMAIGGHFQFKHEKNWDTVVTSSEYDKFFEIDLQRLPIAVMSVPFYERNNIDKNVFTLGDISNMKNRANKFKQKYDESRETRNNNTDINLTSINNNDTTQKVNTTIDTILEECKTKEIKDQVDVESQVLEAVKKSLDFECDALSKFPNDINVVNEKIDVEKVKDDSIACEICINNEINVHAGLGGLSVSKDILDKPCALFNEVSSQNRDPEIIKFEKESDVIPQKQSVSEVNLILNAEDETGAKVIYEKALVTTISTPIIQSSEDLEKWLDDFLDG